MSDPELFMGEYRGSKFVGIVHLDRRVDVSFSPKGRSVRVWIDDEEVSAAPAIEIKREPR